MVCVGLDDMGVSIANGSGLRRARLFERHAPLGLGDLPMPRGAPLGDHVRLGPETPRQRRHLVEVAVRIDPQQVHIRALLGDVLDLLLVASGADHGHHRMVWVDLVNGRRDGVEPLPELPMVSNTGRDPVELVAHRPEHHRRMRLQLINDLQHAPRLLGHHALVAPVHAIALAPDRQIGHRDKTCLMRAVQIRPAGPRAHRVAAALAKKIVGMPTHGPLDVERRAVSVQLPSAAPFQDVERAAPPAVCQARLCENQSQDD